LIKQSNENGLTKYGGECGYRGRDNPKTLPTPHQQKQKGPTQNGARGSSGAAQTTRIFEGQKKQN